MTETPIQIALPLPLDIVISLSQAIDAMYPGAKITTPDGTDRPHQGSFVVVVDDNHRRKRVSTKKLAATKAEPGTEDMKVQALDPQHLALSTPDELGLLLSGPCVHLLAAFEDAVNYVEVEVERGTERYVVAACRSRGQTPHALRRKAEQERDEARAEVDRLRAELEAVRGG